jgi:hypothetical protein
MTNKETEMPSRRKKPARRRRPNKDPTPEQYQALLDAARAATQRLYCEVLETWRACRKPRCRRHRYCAGKPEPCLRRASFDLPAKRHAELQAQVIAGGPRRIPPATEEERMLRGWPLSSVR